MICCGLSLSCGGAEDGGDASVSLELEESVVTPPPAEPAVEPEPPVQPTPASGKRDSGTPTPSGSGDALLALDAWHRSPEGQRAGALRGDGAAMEALSDFAQVFSGGSAAYRSRLKVAPVTAFGTEFEGYARAWAERGTDGLNAALKRGQGSGPAWLAWNDALVEVALSEQKLAVAGESMGSLLAGMLEAGYPRERVLELEDEVETLASQVERFLPAEEYEVPSGDNYTFIARKYREKGHDVYPGWIAEFNREYNKEGGFDYMGLRAGQTLRIPTVSLKLVAWRQARVAALFADGAVIRLYSISVGKETDPTPVGDYTVGKMLDEPMWNPSEGGAYPYGHPENPLGERWIGFAEAEAYAFHGTNSESTVGGFESRGCIRMHNADVVELFELIGPGTRVSVLP